MVVPVEAMAMMVVRVLRFRGGSSGDRDCEESEKSEGQLTHVRVKPPEACGLKSLRCTNRGGGFPAPWKRADLY